jgi:cell division protein FtsQ
MNERIPALKREKEPPRRRGGRLVAMLVLLLVIALVILFFRSSLSKVSRIEVTGVRHLSEADVKKALGVEPGDSFFMPGSGKLEERIRELKPVKSVRVLKKFPGDVEVRVVEYAEVASEIGADGAAKVVLENGLALPAAADGLPDKPVLTGWKPDDAVRKALCEALASMPDGLLSDLSEIQPDPSLSYPDRIKLYTRSRFEVITTVSKLKDKIPYLSEIVENREPGTITMLEADTYMPYSARSGSADTGEADEYKENGTTQ